MNKMFSNSSQKPISLSDRDQTTLSSIIDYMSSMNTYRLSSETCDAYFTKVCRYIAQSDNPQDMARLTLERGKGLLPYYSDPLADAVNDVRMFNKFFGPLGYTPKDNTPKPGM